MRSSHSKDFVSWFRSAAPWLYAFRGKTFVIAFGGELMDIPGRIEALTQDINLLIALGIRVVVVHGTRSQIDAELEKVGIKTITHRGNRVTTPDVLDCVKRAVGAIRLEFEALFSFGLPNTPMAQSEGVRLVSGSFVTAQPLGVIDGIDFQFTGKVRDVDAQTIHHALDNGDIVLLSPMGFSPTGETFNLNYEDVATAAAVALDAEKLIFLIDAPGLPQPAARRKTKISKAATIARELSGKEAEEIFRAALSDVHRMGMTDETVRALDAAVRASKGRVARTHLIDRNVDGACLLELFSYNGIGTMITEAGLERLRDATIDDVGGVLQLIEPLENDGTLVRRGRELIEREITQFAVLEHDGVVAGCAALYPFEKDEMAEMACFVVSPEYRGHNYGERLLGHIEAKARAAKFKRLFVLTTRTGHWFIEHGFVAGDITALPPQKQALYNYQRSSKIFIKKL